MLLTRYVDLSEAPVQKMRGNALKILSKLTIFVPIFDIICFKPTLTLTILPGPRFILRKWVWGSAKGHPQPPGKITQALFGPYFPIYRPPGGGISTDIKRPLLAI